MSFNFKHGLTTLGLAAAIAVTAMGQEALAIPLTLTNVSAGTVGPQSTSNPCIIAGTNCQNPAVFGYNNYKQGGNIDAVNAFSDATLPPGKQLDDGVQGTAYNGAFFFTPFKVAIDVNTAQNGETLDLFEVIVNGVVAYNFTTPTNLGAVSNGNGFADFTLGTIDLTSLGVNDTVLFHAKLSGLSDGAESFFLVADNGGPVINPQCTTPGGCTPTAVPEPSSLAIVGGLASLGAILWWQQRRRRSGNDNGLALSA